MKSYKDLKFRDELPAFLKEHGYKVGVEIGVHQGQFTELFARAGLDIYGVDPWMGFWGQGREQRKDEVQYHYYEEALMRLSPYDNCKLLRFTSMDALINFKDESLDFVYIDGDHNFRHTSEDVYEWSKKVKKGGVVSGHDYWNSKPESKNVVCHVRAAVDAYVNLFQINNLHILSGDKYPSWLWIKE